MLIERFKCIADYIGSKTGFAVSETSVRKWSVRAEDPLPVMIFAKRIGIEQAELDAWIERQRGVRRTVRESPVRPDRPLRALRSLQPLLAKKR